jgi:hypothetical protein
MSSWGECVIESSWNITGIKVSIFVCFSDIDLLSVHIYGKTSFEVTELSEPILAFVLDGEIVLEIETEVVNSLESTVTLVKVSEWNIIVDNVFF